MKGDIDPVAFASTYGDDIVNSLTMMRDMIDSMSRTMVRSGLIDPRGVIAGLSEGGLGVYLMNNYDAETNAQNVKKSADKERVQRHAQADKMELGDLESFADRLKRELVGLGSKAGRKLSETRKATRRAGNRSVQSWEIAQAHRSLLEKQARVIKAILDSKEGGTEDLPALYEKASKALKDEIEIAEEALKKAQELAASEIDHDIDSDAMEALEEEIDFMKEQLADKRALPAGRSEWLEFTKKAASAISTMKKLDAQQQVDDRMVDFISWEKNASLDGAYGFIVDMNLMSGETIRVNMTPEQFGKMFGKDSLNNAETNDIGAIEFDKPLFPRNTALYEKMLANLGKYLHRSFRIYSDPNYEPSAEAKQNVATMIADELTKADVSSMKIERHGPNSYSLTLTNSSGTQSANDLFQDLSRREVLEIVGTEYGPIAQVVSTLDAMEQSNKSEDSILFHKPVSGSLLLSKGTFTVDEDQINELVEHIIEEKRGGNDSLLGSEEVIFQGQSSERLSFNTNILRKKKDLSDAIMDLYGEYTNPEITFANTVMKMANIIAKRKMMATLLEIGEGSMFSRRKHGRMTKQISDPKDPTVAPLDGYFTTPEIHNAFWNKDYGVGVSSDPKDPLLGPILTGMSFLSAWVKKAITVYSGKSQVRDFYGGFINTFEQGMWFRNASNMRKSWKAVGPSSYGIVSKGEKEVLDNHLKAKKAYPNKEFTAAIDDAFAHPDFSFLQFKEEKPGPIADSELGLNEEVGSIIQEELRSNSAEARAYINSMASAEGTATRESARLTRKGVTSTNLDIGVINDALDRDETIFKQDKAFSNSKIGKAKEKMAKADQFAQTTYGMTDDFWKSVQYYSELAVLRKAFPDKSIKELEADAASRVMKTRANYDIAPKILRKMSKHLMFGSFVMFQGETIRGKYNAIGLAWGDMTSKNPVLAAHGAKRFAAQTFSMFATTALSTMVGKMVKSPWDDDDEDVAANLNKPWASNSTLIGLSSYEKGVGKYLDFSYVDPNSMFTKAINALQRKDLTMDEAATEAFFEIFGAFISKDIATQKVFNILVTKRNDLGMPLYNEIAPFWTDVGVGLVEFSGVGVPKIFNETYTLGMSGAAKAGGYDYKDSWGRKIELEDELLGWALGTKIKNHDVRTDFKSKLWQVKAEFSGAQNLYKKGTPLFGGINSKETTMGGWLKAGGYDATEGYYERANKTMRRSMLGLHANIQMMKKAGMTHEEITQIMKGSKLNATVRDAALYGNYVYLDKETGKIIQGVFIPKEDKFFPD
jgi:hypothetical protein